MDKSRIINFKKFLLTICYLDIEFLALGFGNGSIEILNLENLEKVIDINTELGEIKSLKKIEKNYSKNFISLSVNHIAIWDFSNLSNKDKAIKKLITIETSNNELLMIHSLNAKNQFVTSEYNSMKLWSLEKIIENSDKNKIKKSYSEFVLKERILTDKISYFQSCFFSVNYCLLIGLNEGNIMSYDVESFNEVRKYIGHIDSITCINTILSKYFISSSKDKTLRIWHYKQSECCYKILCSETPISFVLSLKILLNDDRFIMIGNTGNEMKILNIDNNTTLKQYESEYYLVNYEILSSNFYSIAIIEGDFHLRLIRLRAEKK